MGVPDYRHFGRPSAFDESSEVGRKCLAVETVILRVIVKHIDGVEAEGNVDTVTGAAGAEGGVAVPWHVEDGLVSEVVIVIGDAVVLACDREAYIACAA